MSTNSRTIGRPRVFNTPEEMAQAIDDYFKTGVKVKEIIVGRGHDKKAVKVEVPTITGLCIHLGFESRQSFYDYEKQADFSYTVKRARMFIENEYEEQLISGNTTGAIFALKNFGWIDRTDHDVTTGGDKVNQIPVLNWTTTAKNGDNAE